jgi:geranylgeranyl pyrophosphate synthase
MDKELDALSEYGVNLGIAFQIADDVLDLIGDEETLGKPAGSDLRQGTITLPVILLAHDLPADSPLSHDIRNGANLDHVVAVVRESDAVDRALGRAREYAAAAQRALAIFPPSEAREALVNLADHVVVRLR